MLGVQIFAILNANITKDIVLAKYEDYLVLPRKRKNELSVVVFNNICHS